MCALAALRLERSVAGHLMSMLDHFQISGPNGTHDCLVLELLGENVPDLRERHFKGERLPGYFAKRIAKQALLALNYLHQNRITHGGTWDL